MKAKFTTEQVRTLCGGTFPYFNGFDWNRVGYFLFEGEGLQPYAGGEILPGPTLTVTIDVHLPF